MTREEAVKEVWFFVRSYVGEFCVGEEEEVASMHTEAREALRTLGVTDSELAEWYP